MVGTEYREDEVYVRYDTEPEEIVDFVKRSIENPIRQGDSIVWNFSTHKVDRSALDIRSKNSTEFIIPYQSTGPWGMITAMLPERLLRAELLVYREDKGEYYAYRNHYAEIPHERVEQIQLDLSRRLEEVLG